jgi:hypothetical protein
MFYVLIFSLLAVVLVFAGISAMTRRRRRWEGEEAYETHPNPTHGDAARRNRKAKRAQSRHDRRKRH